MADEEALEACLHYIQYQQIFSACGKWLVSIYEDIKMLNFDTDLFMNYEFMPALVAISGEFNDTDYSNTRLDRSKWKLLLAT